MEFIKCKKCGAMVSCKVKNCPLCDTRVSAKPMGIGTLIGIIFLGVVIFSAFSNILSSGTENNSASKTTSSPESVTTNSSPHSEAIDSQWSYFQKADEMSKGTTYVAGVLSSNTVNFRFPYSGEQQATLKLRIDPRYGKDVIFSIEKGQILCHSYEDCTVLIRFDDGKALNYTAIGAADNSTETIFIRNYSKFIENMLKAKKVRISATIYQEGSPVFEFDVNGFDQNKFKPKN